MENLENTNNEFNELDDIRQQINAIKDKVDQQGYLNEDLVKKTIQTKMRGIHRTIMLLALTGLLCIPAYIWMKYEQNLSWTFTITTIVMVIAGIITDYLINRIDINHMGDDMVETARKLTQMKRNRNRSELIQICILVFWLLWFCYEKYMGDISAKGSQAALITVILLFVFSAAITAILAYFIHRKMQRANDEMISQIADLNHDQ